MKSKIKSSRLLLAAAGLFVVAAPTYAHWGSASAWAFAANNQTRTCSHTHNNDASATRTARVRAFRTVFVGCQPGDPAGCVEIPGAFGSDDATVTNVSANGRSADVLLFGWDDRNRDNIVPYIASYDDLRVNSARSLSGAVNNGWGFFNLQAQCYVSNDML